MSKNPYCKRCFRDLPADEAVCDRCVAAPRVAKPGIGSILIGVIGIAFVVSGMMTLNIRQCVLGAALLVGAILFNVVKAMR